MTFNISKMGNIFSSEEKLLRHRGNEVFIERNPRKAVRLYEQHKYHQANNLFVRQSEHNYRKRRNVSFHGIYIKNDCIKPKSHSLNAILEELYSFGPEHNSREKETKFDLEGRSLIPRIKLRRSTSNLKDERRYNALYKMSSESEIYVEGNSRNASSFINLRKENNDVRTNVSESNITILLNDENYDEIYDEIPNKSDDNYFTRNFDDCMKRLQMIENEHELIEKADSVTESSTVPKKEERIQMDDQEVIQISQIDEISNYKTECEYKNIDNNPVEKNIQENQIKTPSKSENSMPTKSNQTAELKENDILEKENQDLKSSTDWYSTVKHQFEKKERENQEQKNKEMSCRITGATLKNQNKKSKSEDHEKNTRHYFSRLVKTNKSLIDEELPDPDKVKHIRNMFQEHLNSTLKRKLDKKLGGSLQNISLRATEQHLCRPLSAQCYRNDLYSETQNQKFYEDNDKRTLIKEISTPLRDANIEFHIDQTKKKLFERYEKDLKPGKEYKSRKVLQPKWTDTGSMSSGISSDLSSYDTDLESYSKEGTEQEEMIISDDDLLEEVKDKHYVQNEVLEKIRSFGTSVTYYGGEMITCSVGPLLSPTTQAIIEEIGENYGHETSQARSFDEFYRKYVETNEPNRKKKLGRTRSFGQNDVFQKPNVLSNTEIEMYKNDLEIEIGIKKPVGIPQGSLRKKVTKSNSLGGEMETVKRIPEKYSEFQAPAFKYDEGKSTSEEILSCKDNKPIIQNEIIETSMDEKQISETKLENHNVENHDVTSDDKHAVRKTNGEVEHQKPNIENNRLYLRYKSAPEGLLISKNAMNEVEANSVECPAKEIYFSYEKSIFTEKRKPDMEFEQFEVCETLTEKLEKLEKINSSDKISESQEQEAELQNPSQNETKKEEDNVEVVLTDLAAENHQKENEFQKTLKHDEQTKTEAKDATTLNEKKDVKFNLSRWPIETSVMVDIQKNNEHTPKIITNAKTVAKTKIRLF